MIPQGIQIQMMPDNMAGGANPAGRMSAEPGGKAEKTFSSVLKKASGNTGAAGPQGTPAGEAGGDKMAAASQEAALAGTNGTPREKVLAAAIQRLSGGQALSGKAIIPGGKTAGVPAETADVDAIFSLGGVSGGEALADKIQAILGGQGVDPAGISLDASALEELETLLLGMGFGAGEVEDLMGRLKEKFAVKEGQWSVPMADLLTEIADLGEVQLEEEIPEVVLPLSAIPYIENILTGFGFDPEQVAGVLSKSVRDNGVHVPDLFKALKSAGPQIDGGKAPAGAEDFRNRVAELMNRMGITEVAGEEQSVSFERFMGELSAMVEPAAEEGPALLTRSRGGDLQNRFTGFMEKIMTGTTGIPGTTGTPGTTGIPGATGTPGKVGAQTLDPKVLDGEFEGLKFRNSERVEASAGDGKEGAAALKTTAQGKAAPVNPAAAAVNPAQGAGDAAVEPALPGVRELSAGKGMAADAKPLESSGQGQGGDAGLIRDNGASQENVSPVEGAFRAAERAARNEAPAQPSGARRGLPAHVVNQVSRQLVRSAEAGETELNIHVNPPRLGRLQMTIDHGDGGLRVNIITEQQAARDMLTAHSQELRNALAEQGMQVDKINVQLSGNFDQTMANMRQQGGDGRKKGRGKGGEGISAGGEVSGDIPVATRQTDGDLDLVA